MDLKTAMKKYADATQAMQNYGGNIRKRINKGQTDRAIPSGKIDNYKAINPFPNPFKRSSYEK